MSTQVTSAPFSGTKDMQQLQRIKDKLDAIRDHETSLEKAAPSDRRKIEKSINHLTDSIETIQRNVLETYPDEFVKCRDIGHLWAVKDQEIVDGRMHRTLICSSCSKQRVEDINRHGDVVRRSYVDPEGYALNLPIKQIIGFRKNFWRGIQVARTVSSV